MKNSFEEKTPKKQLKYAITRSEIITLALQE